MSRPHPRSDCASHALAAIFDTMQAVSSESVIIARTGSLMTNSSVLPFAEARHSLARTPAILAAILPELSRTELHTNEGPDTWSPFQVLGHLVYGERVNWIPRIEIALSGGEFARFDRFKHLELFRDASVPDLLREFTTTRTANLRGLDQLGLDEETLNRVAQHPDLGPVSVRQLVATWVLHDWAHLGQITRTVAKGYGPFVGPWRQYIHILER
jgi:uncharacterized damage-inducible protein DinB